MIINGVTIDATFAEAFPMKAPAPLSPRKTKNGYDSAQAMTGLPPR